MYNTWKWLLSFLNASHIALQWRTLMLLTSGRDWNALSKIQKCGRQTRLANSSEMTVIHNARTKKIYEKPTWKLLGSWYAFPPISAIPKPRGKITAARQKRTTAKTVKPFWNSCRKRNTDEYPCQMPSKVGIYIFPISTVLASSVCEYVHMLLT